ncbi:MAG: leucine-rich repeat domain-containing protein [Prevotella sp.]|nr:leucine-rich repeat domain-containing protein [Prevotella sp.]
MKRTLLFIMAFLPILASADAVEIGGIYYNLDNEAKAAEVTSNPNQHVGSDYEAMTAGATSSPNQYEGDVAIPESVTYDDVVYSVTSIGWAAFKSCSGLTSITIPHSVTSIADGAFYGCSGLTSITIPSSVTSIGEWAFSGCSGLTSVTIPNSVTSIGWAAFESCSGLTSITIGNGVISIGDYAFQSCTSLTSITIPSSVTSIGRHPFFDCSDLKSIAVENGNPVYDSRESCNAIIKTSDNELISGCMNSTIPNSVKKIGQAAFQNCKRLRSVRIPNSVVSVGQNAFSGCSGMTSITIPNSVTSIGEAAFRWCSGLTSIIIPSSVTSIGEYVFYNCSGLTSVIIPNSVTFIGLCAFAYCSGLTSVTIPNSVTFIDNHAFQFCSSLTSITIGSGTITIGDQVFACCPELTDVYCYAESVPYTYADSYSNAFKDSSIEYATLHVPAGSVSAYQAVEPWKDFKEIVALPSEDDYRPMIEEGKVWKVGNTTGISDGIVKWVKYYYFDGDTIIDGKTCKKMMCQQFVSPDHPDYASIVQFSSYPLRYVGAWYEENKKVYVYNEINQLGMMYDFSLEANETLLFDNYPYVIGPKQTGGLNGFKGIYRDVMWRGNEDPYYCTTWLEGVGGIDGPTVNIYNGEEGHALFLMSCTVGDEVIYHNDEYEDGTTPADARKKRFDFTHTIKIQPKSRIRKGEEQSLYGEYNDQQLGINLDPLDDAYLVSITDESGKVVYEKAVNAGSIVGLSIDISAYAEGSYTVTVENSSESFTGEFETQTTGIKDIINNKEEIRTEIYNLQGQRLNTLQKGLNIVNGKKIIMTHDNYDK